MLCEAIGRSPSANGESRDSAVAHGLRSFALSSCQKPSKELFVTRHELDGQIRGIPRCKNLVRGTHTGGEAV